MQHERIIETLDGSHWAVTRRAMEQIKAFVSTMDLASIVSIRDDMEAATKNRGVGVSEQDHEYENLYDVQGSVAKLPIYGKIHPRATLQSALSGGTSVESLRNAAKEIDGREDIDKMVLMIDSPGGNVKGLASATSTLRSMNTETVAFAEGTMASGAYWIGSAADRVIVSPNSMVGSIGVYTMLVSKKGKMEDEGIDAKVIRSADKKALGSPSEPIDEEAVKMVQEQVDALHENFVEAVALNRNISLDKARDMADGSVEIGSDAVDTLLADDVMTLDEVMSEEFDLDQDADLTETEQAYAHLSDRYEDLAERHQKALTALRKQQDRIAELEEQVEEGREQEIEAVLDQAIKADQKIAPGRRDELRTRLEEDFEGTKAMLDMMESGAASPSDSLDAETPESAEPANQDEAVRSLKAEGIKVALNRQGAETYENFGLVEGEDFVMIEDAVEEAQDRDLI